MIVAGSANPLLMGVSTGYNLTRSLRFRSSASATLSRTPASVGNRKTWTWSAWVKLGALGTNPALFQSGFSSAPWTAILLQSNGTFEVTYSAGSAVGSVSSSVMRDPSAWYHFVWVTDTTQATAANRVKLYVNGVQQTFSSTNYPSQNFDTTINNTVAHTIGGWSGQYFDGYLAEINFIDGQALTPSSFGETSATTGVWQPKAYTGTYGTNGFYLPFTDNSALTSGSNAGLGKDFSGNGNYWNTNNISITSGSTYDSMTDVPTLTSATAANFCTINPLIPNLQTITDGNLKVAYAAGSGSAIGSIAMTSGKYYWEITSLTASSNNQAVGIFNSLLVTTSYIGSNTNSWAYWNGGQKFTNASGTAYGASWTAGDVIGIAVDADAGSITFYKNNVSQGVAYTGLTGPFYAGHTCYTSSDSMAVNFGQRPFAYTPPTGYVALNTYNLPTPTIGATASSQANKYFDATLYTGTSANQTVTNAGGFQPDLVWTKGRSYADFHALTNAVVGASKWLPSNGTNAEFDYTANDSGVKSFVSNGFTLQADGSGIFNQSGQTYVAWQWKANGSGSSNTAGSITSTVSANTTSGFSVITYTGNGVAGATVGHGLGVAPAMIITKVRSTTEAWAVYHQSLASGYYLELNATGAASNSNPRYPSAPTSSVVTIGSAGNIVPVNSNGATYVMYAFAQIAGYSKFGSYTGNGSSDGVFTYLGFRPRYIMIKNASGGATSSLQGWILIDTARSPYNVTADALFANNSNASSSSSTYGIDILSNGIKTRGTDGAVNESNATYVYMAFAEFPFRYSLAR